MSSFSVIDNFLSAEEFAELDATFPKKMSSPVRSHGDIYVTDEEFHSLTKQWKDFYYKFHNADFWKNICIDMNMGIVNSIDFHPAYFEPRDGCAEIFDRSFTYGRCDIGVGYAGYGKINGGLGVHVDNSQRIISGLLYFSNQEDLEGGEFDICNADGSLVKRIPIKKNRAIISIQHNNAWHRVNPLISGERRAVYFALSASQKIWNR